MLIPLEGWGAKIILGGKEICEPSEITSNAPIDFLKAFCDLLGKDKQNRNVATVYVDCEGPEYFFTFYAGSIIVLKDYYNDEKDYGWKSEVLTGFNMVSLAKELICDIEDNFDYFSKWNDIYEHTPQYKKDLKFWLNKLKSIV